MPQFPFVISLDPYRGNDLKKLAKYEFQKALACQIQEHINAQEEPDKTMMFTYEDISIRLDCDASDVRAILFPIGGGSNGITIGKRVNGEGAKS
jgi:hypothetical protein